MRTCLCLILLFFIASGGYAAPPTPALLSMEAAMRLALSENPEIEMAHLQKKESLLDTQSAEADFLPTLTASASTDLARDNRGQPADHSTFSAGIDAKLNLFSGFSSTAALEAARSALVSQTARSEQTRMNILRDVGLAYLDLLSAQENMAVAAAELEAQSRLRDEVALFVDAGKRSLTDLYQQEAELASARQALTDAVLERRLACQTLFISMGLSPVEDVQAFRPALPLPEGEDTFGQRPDLRAARAGLDTARARVREAAAGNYPQVDLVAGTGTGWSERSEGGFSNQMWADSAEARIGLRLSIPVFDAFHTRNARASALLGVEIRRAELKESTLAAEKERAEARARHENALLRLDTSRARLKAAQAALDAMTERYRIGAATLTELSTARATLVSARYQRVEAETDHLRKILLLRHALGAPLLVSDSPSPSTETAKDHP